MTGKLTSIGGDPFLDSMPVTGRDGPEAPSESKEARVARLRSQVSELVAGVEFELNCDEHGGAAIHALKGIAHTMHQVEGLADNLVEAPLFDGR